ncbi:MAG TPA: alternative ribosome rescue aminoacyl-tRNA hydrolase ArfB [Actinomycetota bacterium]|nr:alternative ribosome rescue aminoacyl-tRNA hydrolase ArfB [Actinomycetota bacterium]
MKGLPVSRSVTIPLNEIDLTFSTSGGPGGQHANRSSTRVTAVWNVDATEALGPRQKQRVHAALRSRIDSSGNLRLSSDRHRSQMRNRDDVLDRLAAMVADALVPRRSRVATTPTSAGKQRRLAQKRRRSEVKQQRRRPAADD